jgi:hypothetical protein
MHVHSGSFFQKSEVFSTGAFREKVKSLTGKEWEPSSCAATFNNFVKRGILKNVGKGKYYFLGLEARSFEKLKNLGFDVADDMRLFEEKTKNLKRRHQNRSQNPKLV